jgi:hypothetical protein
VPSATGADREKRFFIAHGKTIFDVVNARRPFVSVFVDVNVTQVWFISLLLERARIEHLNARSLRHSLWRSERRSPSI